MNSLSVSIYLTSLLALSFFISKNKVAKHSSLNVFFVLLFIMVSPGFVLDIQNIFFWGEVGIVNLSLFFFLLLLTSIPWLLFEKWFKNKPSLSITPSGVRILNTVFTIVIISCLFSYIYIAPYALRSFSMGAADTRALVNSEGSVLPSSIFTTFAVGVSSISPFYIFLFFLSLLHPSLKRFSFGLFVSSFVYVWVSMPFMARDGFVTLPVFYIIFYLIFRNSLDNREKKKVRKYFYVVASVAGVLLLTYSISRFYNTNSSAGNRVLNLIDGTWGYIYQQPYVFDRTVNLQTSWHGLGMRFPLLADFLGIPCTEVVRTQDFETMFGTMLSEFYSIGGYWSLFVFTFSFIFIYSIGLKVLMRKGNLFSIFFLFITYLIIEVTGLFYYRYGGTTFNWLFLILTLLPFFMSNRIIQSQR